MGSNVIKSTVGKLDPFRGGDSLLEKTGIPTLTGSGSDNVLDMGKTAQLNAATSEAAEQAQATRDAANVQAQATRDASTQQATSVRDQAAAAVAAQTAAINQQAQAAQLAAQQAAQPQEGNPDIQLDGFADGSDPRRKYQGGGQPSIGGTMGGVGIRL